MQALDAPSLADDGDERAGIFLTNALTGFGSPASRSRSHSRNWRRNATFAERV